MAEFDPSKPFEVADAGPKNAAREFDPSKPFDVIDSVKTTEAPAENPGIIGRTINSVKHMADGISLPGSFSEATDRVVHGQGLLRANQSAPTTDETGKIKDLDPSKSVGSGDMLGIPEGMLPELAAAEGAPFVQKLLRFVANASVRTGANAAGAGADAGTHVLSHGGSLGEASDAAKEAAAQTAILGGAGELAGGAIGGIRSGIAATGAGDAFKSAAERKAFKAAVGNQAKAYNEAAARGVINERGREFLDAGTVGFGDSAQNIADKAAIQRNIAGKGIGNLSKEIDARAPEGAVSGQNMANEIRAYADKIGGSGNKSLVAHLNDAADDLEKEGAMTFDRAQTHKDSWDWHPGSAVTHKVARAVKGIIGDEMESAIGRLDQPSVPVSAAQAAVAQPIRTGTDSLEFPGIAPSRDLPNFAAATDRVSSAVGQAAPELPPIEQQALASSIKTEMGPTDTEIQGPVNSQRLKDYQDLKSRYGANAAAVKDAQINANRYEKNNGMSLGDKAAAAAGAVLNPHGTVMKMATGAASGVANKLFRKRGASSLAVSLDKIGDILNADPEAFGQFSSTLREAVAQGPQKLAVTHYILSQKNPEYSQMTMGDQ